MAETVKNDKLKKGLPSRLSKLNSGFAAINDIKNSKKTLKIYVCNFLLFKL